MVKRYKPGDRIQFVKLTRAFVANDPAERQAKALPIPPGISGTIDQDDGGTDVVVHIPLGGHQSSRWRVPRESIAVVNDEHPV